METKRFNPFDKVLVRDEPVFPKWTCDFYSHYDNDIKQHVTSTMTKVEDKDILPYEGNEHLVGTADKPDEEVRLTYGEIIIAIDKEDFECNFSDGVIGKVVKFKDKFIERNGEWGFSIPGGCNGLAIRFSDFDPEDMEETKKHILCVRNGKIVKYKG